jgi:ABC-2 type transport system ATP-binding protein
VTISRHPAPTVRSAVKSTTIRLLMGLHQPTKGKATVLGLDPVRDAAAIHRQTGYLPGELALHPRLTGRQHVDFAARARGMPDRTYLGDLVERFGVNLDQPARALSKGNRQKIGIVLAFMHRPGLLIVDEPTSGLDPLMQDEFERLIRETVADGRTVFLSSHELDEVQRLADRVTIIKDGKLIVTDTVDGLRRSAPRTIEFRVAGDIDPGRFSAIDGVQVTEAGPGRITLTVRGPVAPVLRTAAGLDPVDVTARPADLDELFLAYYRGTPAREHADAR